MSKAIVFAMGCTLLAGATQAKALATGNDAVTACQWIANEKLGRTLDEAARSGDCSGMIATLMAVGSHLQPNMRICAPSNATPLQGVKVFRKFMQDHPERLHQASIVLAIDALRAAWPCG